MRRISIINFMLSSLMLTCFSCSDNKVRENIPAPTVDRFASKFIDISETAEIKRLTEVKRDMMPFFSPSGERIYFSRLLITGPEDVDSNLAEAVENYFSLDYKTNQLYILREIPEFPVTSILPGDSLPSMMTETPIFGIRTPSALYFTTRSNAQENMRNIYKAFDDSLMQLTYGSESSFLQLVSPDERYLVFLYDHNHSSIVLYDNHNGNYYIVPKSDVEKNRHDFAPQFSPDSKYLVFLRSGDLYMKDFIPFGDIWLVEFKNE